MSAGHVRLFVSLLVSALWPARSAGVRHGATYYEAAERPSLGGGQWIVLPDDTTYFRPTEGDLRPALIAAHTLRERSSWVEVTQS